MGESHSSRNLLAHIHRTQNQCDHDDNDDEQYHCIGRRGGYCSTAMSSNSAETIDAEPPPLITFTTKKSPITIDSTKSSPARCRSCSTER